MRRVVKWAAVALSLAPGACHYKVTGPILWAHTSSAAFDAWVGLWIMAALLPFYVFVAIKSGKRGVVR